MKNQILNKMTDAVFPQNETCDVCLEELPYKTRLNLCSSCLEKLPFNDKKICLCCGAPMDNEADYCLRCMGTKRSFDKCRSVFVYEGLAKKVLLSFKYGEKKYLKSLLAKLMTDKYLSERFEADVVTFVPMTKKEQRKRGYNQSELLAKEIADSLSLECCPSLEKVKESPEQKSLSAKERAKNLEGVFSCSDMKVKGKKVLLVDDVFTTGATANECAKALLRAGATNVLVLTACVTALKPYMA